MPVMFVHGDQDEVVTPQSMPEVEGLQAAASKMFMFIFKKVLGMVLLLMGWCFISFTRPVRFLKRKIYNLILRMRQKWGCQSKTQYIVMLREY